MQKNQFKLILFGAIFSLLAVVAVIGCNKTTDTKNASMAGDAAAKPAMSPAERGKYLVTVGGCNDCHTPLKMGQQGPEPDFSRMLSGHPSDLKLPPPPKPEGPWIISSAYTLTAWAGPWGISFTKNITPDSTTGIGKWDETTFMLALRNGKHMGNGRNILPPMPWQMIKQMTDDDLKAVYAFLRTIPPIHNEVPEAVIAMPPTADASAPHK